MRRRRREGMKRAGDWGRMALVATALAGCAVEKGGAQPFGSSPGVGASGESASAPPCATRWVYPDRDGDGFTLQGEGLELCADVSPPDGFSPPSEEPDCDDADAARFRERCFDRDGDGATSPECIGDAFEDARACPWILEWTPEPGPSDCDDADPSRVDYFYVDADGDGVGAGEPVCLLPGPGYSAWGGDCDDADAARSPRVFEISGDGIDSDCDDLDDGRCAALVPLTNYRFGASSVVDPSCAGPSLALGYASCSSCLVADASVAVENRGSATFSGRVTVSGVTSDMLVELEPGERKLLVSGPFVGDVTLGYAEPSVTDCAPADNAIFVPGGHCI